MEKLRELIEQARRQDWESIDKILAAGIEQGWFEWAKDMGLRHSHAQVRDLAASILEKSDSPIGAEDLNFILARIERDPNKYVGYRLAFALWRRGRHSDVVRQAIQKASTDPDVGGVAREYLREG